MATNQTPIVQGQNMSKTVQVELVFDGKEFNLEKITADYVKGVIQKRFGIFMSGITLKANEVAS
jgi:hypothetical protein